MIVGAAGPRPQTERTSDLLGGSLGTSAANATQLTTLDGHHGLTRGVRMSKAAGDSASGDPLTTAPEKLLRFLGFDDAGSRWHLCCAAGPEERAAAGSLDARRLVRPGLFAVV